MTDTEKRDMLVRLARDVMGWRYWDGKDDAPETMETLFTDAHSTGWLDVYENASFNPTIYWNPCDEIADAWMLVEALNRKHYLVNTAQLFGSAADAFGGAICHVVTIHRYKRLAEGWSCDASAPLRQELADTLPLAICLAAIAVLDAGGAS